MKRTDKLSPAEEQKRTERELVTIMVVLAVVTFVAYLLGS